METFATRYPEDVELIDVREPVEYVGGHVPADVLGRWLAGLLIAVVVYTGVRSLTG